MKETIRQCLCMVIGMIVFAPFLTTVGQTNKKLSPTSYISAPNDIAPLKLGDKVPDLTFQNVLNYKKSSAKLSDFRSKLVLLDFWSVWCTSCIAAFPKMEKLQSRFGDKIQILLVNSHGGKYDSEEKVKAVMLQNQKRTGFFPTLPIPIQDTILNKYFPHKSVPRYVWIDSLGTIIGITDQLEVTENNIQAFLEGKNIKLELRDDDLAYNRETSLLQAVNAGSQGELTMGSVLTGYQEGLGTAAGSTLLQNGKVIKLYSINRSLKSLLFTAYADVFKHPDNRLIVELGDSNPLKKEIHEERRKYCYELIVPFVKDDNVYAYLQEDLARNLRIRAKNEIRERNCYNLIITRSKESYISKATEPVIDLDKSNLRKYMTKQPISALVDVLNALSNVPILDETGLSQFVDIDFPTSLYELDLTALQKFLQSKGFDLVPVKRPIEVAVIFEK